jgi:Flp pilus assembly protein TadD
MEVYELYRTAEQHLAARDAESAVPLLEQAAQELPGDRSVDRLLALAYYGVGALEPAEGVLRRLVAADPLDADALHMLGQVLSRTGRADEAQQHLAMAGRITPAYAVACDVWAGDRRDAPAAPGCAPG